VPFAPGAPSAQSGMTLCESAGVKSEAITVKVIKMTTKTKEALKDLLIFSLLTVIFLNKKILAFFHIGLSVTCVTEIR
jgi:hypothetical protein